MTAHDCRSELLVEARRGRLSEPGRLALDAHLAACPSCRSSYEVSTDFDVADAVDLHDGARIRALADLARGRIGRRGGSVFARARSVAAALIVLGGSASAAVWWWRRPVPSPTSAARVPAGRPIEAAIRPRAASPAAVATTPTPEALPVRQRALRPAARAVALARPIELAGAAAILQQATEARQRGERAQAADLYRRLQREFPASPEAMLSAVPLGGLLLGDGLPRAALTEFDGYLARAHGGALIPEALYGRARALGRLGDRGEERKAWTRLCADFPDSAYAQLGRHRLTEIE
ncbi:MAG TPA: tetratricopeptide repeat protein [Polyangia bacterium]|jgi:TolA-binding protein|nr:tetratricopeptide repeat protein [Polyangia bacterium]